MTEDIQFMRDSVAAAIEAHLASKGGGFLSSFVYACEAVDADGQSVMFLGGPLEQDTVRSLGLTSYLGKWFDEEARELMAASKHCHDECCNSDEDD